MAKCRIQTLTPSCSYNAAGVVALMLLDIEDFVGFVFEGEGLYQSCYVESVARIGDFIELDFKDYPAQYSGQLNAGLYTHSVEAFIPELSAEILANLHLATKRPQLVLFKTQDGKIFTFGQDNGAKLTYSGQTAENTGASINISQNSIYPLYEVSPDVFKELQPHPATWLPVWDDTAICEIDGDTDTFNGYQQATLITSVSAVSGEALDEDGVPVSISGKLQAARVLVGEPSPSGFTIVGTFNTRQVVNGEPTIRYAPEVCEEGVVAEWILTTGFWDNSSFWLDDGIWNY